MKQTQAVKFPFRKRSLPFLSQLKKLRPVIDSVSIKNKEDCNPG